MYPRKINDNFKVKDLSSYFSGSVTEKNHKITQVSIFKTFNKNVFLVSGTGSHCVVQVGLKLLLVSVS